MRQLKGGSNTNHVQNLELGAIDVNHFEQINGQGVIEPTIPWQLSLACWLFLACVFTRLAAMQSRDMTKLMVQTSHTNADSLRKFAPLTTPLRLLKR